MIEVKQLELSPDNVRRAERKAAIGELKASLLAHGLMQNLVVTDAGGGRYRVIAGGRRLEALRQLQAEGRLPETHRVPCQIVADERAFELSLAENIVRQAMHPADEFDAFSRLAEDGATIDAIAARFGVGRRHVEQRLKLGRLAPELLAAYRAEALALDCLMALTISDDHAKQLSVYGSLAPWQASDPAEIRAALTGEMLEASGKLARFVGLDAYHAAGGASRADLFGEEVYLEDAELLHRLAAEKLDAARQALEAEGWKWVEVNPDRDWSVIHGCGRIHPQPADAPPELLAEREQAEAAIEAIHAALEDSESDELIDTLDDAEAKLAGIEDKLASFAAYDRREMGLAGCYVSIGQDGELLAEKGLVARADLKALSPDDAGRIRKPKGMPETLRRDLEAYRLQAAQLAVATHRLVALDLLSFTLAKSTVARRGVEGGPDMRLLPHGPTPRVRDDATPAGEALKELAEGLPRGWLEHRSEAEQFQAFLALPEAERLGFLAYAVATSLKPQLSLGKEGTAFEMALSLTDTDFSRVWRPTRANYLGRVSRDQLLSLGRRLLGDQWADARSRDKKGEVADALERAFADPGRQLLPPERMEAVRRWLPEGMAFGSAVTATEDTREPQAA